MPRYPVDNRIVRSYHIPFGDPDPNSRWKRHAGDDSANGAGTPVYAPASGVVTPYRGDQYQGKVVEIFDGQYYPHVFHLQSQEVAPGKQVSLGQLIGYSGNTGLSTGAHVHFGVGKKSLPNITSFSDFINPLEYIKGGASMNPLHDEVVNVYQRIDGRKPTAEEIAVYTSKPWTAGDGLLYGKILVSIENLQKWLATASKARDDATGIAGIRGGRLDEIAKLVGAKNGDDYQAIVSKIKAGTGVAPKVLEPGVYEVPKG